MPIDAYVIQSHPLHVYIVSETGTLNFELLANVEQDVEICCLQWKIDCLG